MKILIAFIAIICMSGCANLPMDDGPHIYPTEEAALRSSECALKNPGDQRLILPYGDGFTCEIQNGN